MSGSTQAGVRLATEQDAEAIGRLLHAFNLEFNEPTPGAPWADRIELGTSEDDHAARVLYESLGFTSREQGPDGPVMYVYEREL